MSVTVLHRTEWKIESSVLNPIFCSLPLSLSLFRTHRELKRIFLLIDNFVPIEVKTRLYTQARYDEELEEWTNNSNRLTDNTQLRRPVSQPHRRRPISEYAMKVIQRNDDEAVNIRGENILMHELDMPLRTTTDYKNPKISASLQAVLAEALQTDDDVDITGQVCRCNRHPEKKNDCFCDWIA